MSVQTYLKRATSEYQTAANFLAWLSANLQLYQDIQNCLASFAEAFSITTAAGPQLDILGSLIGQSRTVGFQPSDSVSPILDDPTYRLLLQATIAKNHWDGTTVGLLAIWKILFPGGTLIVSDHQDMTVDLFVAAPFTSILIDLILNGYILPRPEGVLYTYTLAQLPMFGFDVDDAYIGPLDVGYFV